jgi:hypothetical protein
LHEAQIDELVSVEIEQRVVQEIDDGIADLDRLPCTALRRPDRDDKKVLGATGCTVPFVS